jgi:hypothetical protein
VSRIADAVKEVVGGILFFYGHTSLVYTLYAVVRGVDCRDGVELYPVAVEQCRLHIRYLNSRQLNRLQGDIKPITEPQ